MPETSKRVPLRERIDRAKRFVQKDVWEVEPSSLGRVRAWVNHNIRFAILIAEGSLRSHLLLRAGALTFKTVFSIVPLLAVMLAFFKAFRGTEAVAEKLKKGALGGVLPGLDRVAEFINQSISDINAGAVGSIGLLVLLYTAISLLTTIEQSFNDIWGVKKGRSFVWRCIIYWGVLTLAPLVATLSVTATSSVENGRLMQLLREYVGFADDVVLFLMPFVVAWLGFAAIYYFMPNTQVRFRSAFAGGMVAGTLWEAAKHAYIFYVSHAVTPTQIYGALGIIPLFLLWVYISWIIVLFGAEWSFAGQHVKTYRREIATGAVSVAAREELALKSMLLVAGEFHAGRDAVTARRIGEAFNVPTRLVNDVLFQLGGAGLVREVTGSEAGYVPGRDPAAIPVKTVLDAIRRAGAAPAIGRQEEDGVVRTLLARAESAMEKELGGVSVGELVKKTEAGEA